MATLCTTDADVSILTPNYMTLLQSLCTITTPSINDVTAIFKEFRRSLDARKPKHSSASTSSLSTSSGTSKKRGGKSAGRGGGDSDDAGGGGERGGGRSDVGFERSCTWEPDKKRCWIMSDLDLWNRILSRDCVELRENKWGELTLQGYEWPENSVEPRDMLCASLLIHLLLRQHRCVTSVSLDMSITTVERHVIWHVLKTGGVSIKCLTFKPFFLNLLGLMTSIETTMWSEAVSAMTNLKILHISSIYICAEVARTLGGYVEHATALRTLLIVETKAPDTDAGVFLDFLSRNRTLEVLCVELPFLMARNGQALADVVRNHVTLNRLEVTGTFDSTPSALLAAAVVSPALRSLKVQTCAIRAEDVDAMASALTLHVPSRACEGECSTDMAPPPPTSRLEELIFLQCAPCGSRLEEAYANLIGGVLLHLKVAKCSLGEPFAVAAAANLLLDKRLQKLDLEDNEFPVSALFYIIDALEVNKTLKVLSLNTPAMQPEEEVSMLFELIEEIDVFSRLKFHCVRLRASHFAALVRASKAATIYQHLDEVGVEDAVEFLDALASARSVGLTWLECTTPADQRVVQKLTDTLARIKSLRHLLLRINLPEADVVNMFRALESNRSIGMIEFRGITFRKRTAKALGRLIERNRSLAFLTIHLDESEPDVDYVAQLRGICRELKEALLRNRFVINVEVLAADRVRSNQPIIRDSLRRNAMLVNEAVRFVKGSTEKNDALAFETLEHCLSLLISLRMDLSLSHDSALEKISEARERLAFNYFILAGVVKAKIVCGPRRKKKTMFDKLGKDMQARICSYLSLNDVMDI